MISVVGVTARATHSCPAQGGTARSSGWAGQGQGLGRGDPLKPDSSPKETVTNSSLDTTSAIMILNEPLFSAANKVCFVLNNRIKPARPRRAQMTSQSNLISKKLLKLLLKYVHLGAACGFPSKSVILSLFDFRDLCQHSNFHQNPTPFSLLRLTKSRVTGEKA